MTTRPGAAAEPQRAGQHGQRRAPPALRAVLRAGSRRRSGRARTTTPCSTRATISSGSDDVVAASTEPTSTTTSTTSSTRFLLCRSASRPINGVAAAAASRLAVTAQLTATEETSSWWAMMPSTGTTAVCSTATVSADDAEPGDQTRWWICAHERVGHSTSMSVERFRRRGAGERCRALSRGVVEWSHDVQARQPALTGRRFSGRRPTASGICPSRRTASRPSREDQRYGTPRRLFTVWFAPQVNMTGVFTGTLAIALGLGFLAGPARDGHRHGAGLAGGGYLSTWGPRTGTAQLPNSRMAFGGGVVLPAALQWLSSIAWDALVGLFGGEALAVLLGIPFWVAVLIVLGRAGRGRILRLRDDPPRSRRC